MIDDIDKGRVAHVANMEQQLEHLRAEYDRYKALAEKWEPVITTETDAQTQKTKIGLKFGGKHVHATVTANFLQEMDTTGAVSQITDVLVEGLMAEQLAKVLRPHVERVQKSVIAVAGAGKW